MKIRKIVGENIRSFRTNLGWSQEKLGAETGLHHDYIGRLERGSENVGIDNLIKIAEVLKVDPADLLKERFPGTKNE
ncbi:MAG: helix-turn-helix transcriptional regulator [Bacteroidota bacterium]|nr:helix-turn-helix transcriptional regulator [Bacteroidota bacterium]MDP4229705.1 helix-turn-helix transcriptional regulator [Bacteroidota bacterium]MDP4237314.1 helix-turn-helix transcriptional regulator [Bacteroidota bacterium]